MNQKKQADSSIVNNALTNVFKSTSIVFFGSIIGSIILYIIRILIIRNWSQDNYGIFVLTFGIVAIFLGLSGLGLKNAIVRYIAYYRGKNEDEKVSETISSSFPIIILMGILASVFLFIFAEQIATIFFHNKDLILPIRIISIVIPFTKIINFMATSFQGYDDVKPGIIYNNLVKNIVYLTLLVIIVFQGLPYIYIFYAYLLTIILSSILIVIHAIKKLKINKKIKKIFFKKEVLKKLLVFSTPLLFISILSILVNWIDTFLLAGLKNLSSVALYNAAIPTAKIISSPLTAMTVIYLPIVTGLFSQKKFLEMKRNFTILVKWLLLITLPIFLIFFLFSEEIILFLFGFEYIAAVSAFRLACLGAILFNIIGLSNQNLFVTGKTVFVLIAFIIAFCLNVILDYFLIPIYGSAGAAFSNLIAVTTSYILMTLKIYYDIKIHPFSKNLFKTAIVSTVIITLFYFTIKNFIKFNILMIVLFFIFSYAIVFFSLVITKSYDREDLDLIKGIEKKFGINLSLVKRFLR